MDNQVVLAKLAEMEKTLKKLDIMQKCSRVFGHYEVIHTPELMRNTAEEVFALWRDDCSMEVSDWGVWTGPKAVKYLFEVVMLEDEMGTMLEHHLDTPMIEVAGDLQTAKGVWWSSGMESVFTPTRTDLTPDMALCVWSWGKYAVDFIRNPETDEWKIWHLKWFRTLRVNYDKNWIEDELNFRGSKGFPKGKDAMNAAGIVEGPTTFHRPYRSDYIRHPFPIPAEPYETYDGSFRWMFGNEELQKTHGVNLPD